MTHEEPYELHNMFVTLSCIQRFKTKQKQTKQNSGETETRLVQVDGPEQRPAHSDRFPEGQHRHRLQHGQHQERRYQPRRR